MRINVFNTENKINIQRSLRRFIPLGSSVWPLCTRIVDNPGHANASTTHFNFPDHSIEDMALIPLELQPTLNTSRRKAREAYLIHRGQTLEPKGMNRRNER